MTARAAWRLPPVVQLGATDPADPAAEIDSILERGSIAMVYQPIFELHGRSIVGYEALARFGVEPRRPPNLWFDDAASVGLRRELELTALSSALAGLPKLPADAFLCINASPSTVVSSELIGALAGQPLDRIVLEVTEQEAIGSYEEFSAAIEPLRRAGLRLAIDDVGAGFASLTHIVRLVPDVLKLDRALTADISASSHVRALAAALTSFALEIRSVVLAEGIETEQQLSLLGALGVSLGQGFLLGHPAPLPE